MGFFDLNIPFLEPTKPSPQSQTLKQNRLKLLIRTMELGYTGVAYNRTIKGVISDADYCPIPLFTVSSLIKLLPSFSSAVKFHRDLLGDPPSAPFRQYTRLTVCLDSAAQAMVLNSSNAVLKSYNIVAAKPLNQNAFDQACQFSEVDIISIDFTDRLPFRLKQPIIKAAIQRGVYFEIIYSGLVRDVQTRFQVISNAKMLVDWTGGKSIILTSATSSANELRGPYDIANLASLLGMSMEHAKAAVSKNCRNLISKALRKRQYYKEAVKVEALTASEQLKFNVPSSGDWFKWDPISSGQGDLLLDDVEKGFLASSDDNKVKAIDFDSIMNSLPSNGLQLKDIISGATPLSESPNQAAELSHRVGNATYVVLSTVKDAEVVDTPWEQSQNQVADLCDTIKDATNAEPALSKSKDTVVGDTPLVKCRLMSHSILQSSGSCAKDSSSDSESLVSQQPSQAADVNDGHHMEIAEPFQSKLEANDVLMTDLPMTNPNVAHDKIKKSSLVQNTEFELRITHEATVEEPIRSNVSDSPFLSAGAARMDLHSQNCVLNSELDILQSEEGIAFQNHDAGYGAGLCFPSAEILNLQSPKIVCPEIDVAL
uniref:Uncharacterized protein n=1 Tax=Kalanchoe fedtschenkoi TaxID=63787 RepID=A0A7N0RAH6_KALFE